MIESSSDFLSDLEDVDLGLLGADVCREGRSNGVGGVDPCCGSCRGSSVEESRLTDLWHGPLVVDFLRASSAKPWSSMAGEADFVDSAVIFCGS